MQDRAAIIEAKRRLPLPDLWTKLGLPGVCKRVTSSPWRQDKNPSMSISSDGMLWKDHGTGDGGDAITFLEKLYDLPKKDAIQRLLELAGIDGSAHYALPKRPPIQPTARPKPELPPLRVGTAAELATVAGIRQLPIHAIQAAQDHGLLHFAPYKEEPCWFITDSHRSNCQARKLSGQPWEKAKALTLPGSWASWPIGIMHAKRDILMVEGGPDLLAAFAYVEQFNLALDPVCLFGASQTIHPMSLPLFLGKTVTICPHNDEAGNLALQKWTEALQGYATVEVLHIPAPHKDLNDWMTKEIPE